MRITDPTPQLLTQLTFDDLPRLEACPYSGTIPADLCRNRHRGNPESRQAAHNARARMPEVCDRILAHLDQCGPDGATCDELSLALGIHYTTCSPACTLLKMRGLAVKQFCAEAPGYVRRPTRRGSLAAVLILWGAGPARIRPSSVVRRLV